MPLTENNPKQITLTQPQSVHQTIEYPHIQETNLTQEESSPIDADYASYYFNEEDHTEENKIMKLNHENNVGNSQLSTESTDSVDSVDEDGSDDSDSVIDLTVLNKNLLNVTQFEKIKSKSTENLKIDKDEAPAVSKQRPHSDFFTGITDISKHLQKFEADSEEESMLEVEETTATSFLKDGNRLSKERNDYKNDLSSINTKVEILEKSLPQIQLEEDLEETTVRLEKENSKDVLTYGKYRI